MFIISVIFAFPFVATPQIDSIQNAIKNTRFVIPESIVKYNNLILYNIYKNNYEGAKRAVDSLTNEVADSSYKKFNPPIYPLILYWIRDYNGLLNYFRDFECLQASDSGVKELYGWDLKLELTWSIPEEGKKIMDSIKKTELKNKQQEALRLGLYKQMIDVDYPMSYSHLNWRANRFLLTHPFSEYNYYIKKQVKYRPKTYVSYGIFSSLGYGINTGELKDNLNNNLAFATGLELYYYRFAFSLSLYLSQSKTKQDITYPEAVMPEGLKANTNLYQFQLGYAIKTRFYKLFVINPFIGIGLSEILPSESATDRYPELQKAGIKSDYTYSAGLNFDLNIGRMIFISDRNPPYIIVRLSYSYNHMQFGGTTGGMTGGMHIITLGLGYQEVINRKKKNL